MKTVPIITIDGPSASGKGEVARYIAKELKWNILDSGIVYRSLAYVIYKNKISLNNLDLILFEAKRLSILHDTYLIRSNEISLIAAKIATYSSVRFTLLAMQHKLCVFPGLVAEGRDMGSVVFPGASLKIFLTADIGVRVNRRYKQLNQFGISVKIQDVFNELTKRDRMDEDRLISPLVSSCNALIIYSSNLTIEEVAGKILNAWRK